MNFVSIQNSRPNHAAVGARVTKPRLVRILCLLIAMIAFPLLVGQANAQVAFSINDQFPQSNDIVEQIESQSYITDSLSSNTPESTFTMLFGIDGSKQPQDFGVNANLGVIGQLSFSAPLIRNAGIGFQVGNSTTFSGNAVQVFELLGETKDRFQNFTTVGVFQRQDSGISWGVAYDFLSSESFDSFQLGQWRVGATLDVGQNSEIGVTVNLADRRDTASFNAQLVELEPIEQLRIHLRKNWQTGVNTTFWIGVADQHSEENAITGTLPKKQNQILFGADIFAPLNHWMAIYGETTLLMPSDTGAVDAFLGMQISPQSIRRAHDRSNRFRPLLPVAAGPSFSVDLNRR